MSRELRPIVSEGLAETGRGAVALSLLLVVVLLLLLFWLEATRISSFVELPIGGTVGLAALGGLVVALVALDEKIWVYSAIFALITFVLRPEQGKFGPLEAAYLVVSLLGLVVWFAKEIAVYRASIVRSRFDLAFLSIVSLCIVVGLLGMVLRSGDVRFGLPEMSAFFTILLYFPIRKVLRTDRDLLTLFLVISLLGLVNGAVNLMNYQEKVVATALAFGSVNARSSMNELLSSVLVCANFAIVAMSRRMLVRLLALGGFALFFGILVLSLSRGPILSTVAGCAVALVLVARRRIGRIALYGIIAAALNLGAAMLLFPDYVESIGENMLSRFEAVETIGGDKALGSRFVESQALVEEFIPASPLIGHGFGVPYTFYDAPFRVTSRAYYTHNGYLSPLFKFGIPLGAALIFVILSPLFRLPFASLRQWSRRNRLYAAGAIAALVTIMMTNVTSNALVYYTELTILAMVLAIFDVLFERESG